MQACPARRRKSVPLRIRAGGAGLRAAAVVARATKITTLKKTT